MRIAFLSDCHGGLDYSPEVTEQLMNDEFDVCIMLGDMTAQDIKIILSIIPKHKIYGILGNHDYFHLDYLADNNIPNIHGKVVNINGVRIGGMQGSFKYKENCASSPLYTHEESLKISKQLTNIDILVSHDKPFIAETIDASHDGLRGITECIYRNKVKYHVHGHLHIPNTVILPNGTKSICVYQYYLLDIRPHKY